MFGYAVRFSVIGVTTDIVVRAVAGATVGDAAAGGCSGDAHPLRAMPRLEVVRVRVLQSTVRILMVRVSTAAFLQRGLVSSMA